MTRLKPVFWMTLVLSIVTLIVMIFILMQPTNEKLLIKVPEKNGLRDTVINISSDDQESVKESEPVKEKEPVTERTIDDPEVADLALQIAKAKRVLKQVKVACFITTQPSMIRSKLAAVSNTWAPRIDKIFYLMTDNKTMNISFPNLLLVNITNDRQHLTEKTVFAFKYLYKHHLNEFEWFLKADDDSYIIVENLKYLLSQYNSSKPIYLGHHFKHYSQNGYMSGGGSYVLSREALRLLVENGYNVPGRCRQKGGAEDIETGRCLTKAGALVHSSVDNRDRESFHPMNIYGYIIGPLPKWIVNYDRNQAKVGNDCCSQLTISFHYTGPKLMSTLDFLLYRTSVYGRNLDYGRLKNFFKLGTVPPPGPETKIIPYFFEKREDYYKNATAWRLRNNTVL
ncbi:hypothetical protein SNE40_007369 [Patella caerulea]|uniref:N-acetylgalactosaminide beta-1,3-galactosyltransferase n=1 Tax=Patella caerulea TaxID=87958 RepID=A0AAN8JYN6_PATCE